MRIAIGALIHQTSPGAPLTMMEAFTLYRDDAVRAVLPALVLPGHDIVPLFAAISAGGGPLMRETFHVLAVELVHRLAARRPVDRVLLALSGGLAIEDEPDGNAELLERVRNVLPPGLPIHISLAPNAAVTDRMRQPGVSFDAMEVS
jgi:microcystin degradation protein MlrC